MDSDVEALCSLDLGPHERLVSGATPQVQRLFTAGLNHHYAFDHAAAVRCFRAALALDAGCALAHFGVALSSGAHYNSAWTSYGDELPRIAAECKAAAREAEEVCFTPRARATAPAGLQPAARRRRPTLRPPAALTRPPVARQAVSRSITATPADRALVAAIAARHAAPHAPPPAWDRAYAERMRAAALAFPDDPDVAALAAEAVMQLRPWALWDLDSGEAAPEGAEARAILERGLAVPGAHRHIGLLHFFLHVLEMSPAPGDASAAADALRGLAPGAGHLLHSAPRGQRDKPNRRRRRLG